MGDEDDFEIVEDSVVSQSEVLIASLREELAQTRAREEEASAAIDDLQATILSLQSDSEKKQDALAKLTESHSETTIRVRELQKKLELVSIVYLGDFPLTVTLGSTRTRHCLKAA